MSQYLTHTISEAASSLAMKAKLIQGFSECLSTGKAIEWTFDKAHGGRWFRFSPEEHWTNVLDVSFRWRFKEDAPREFWLNVYGVVPKGENDAGPRYLECNAYDTEQESKSPAAGYAVERIHVREIK